MVTGEESTRHRLNDDSEIVSLFPRPSCPKPPNFPIKKTLALYGRLSAEGPLLCGFSDQEKGCFKYQIRDNNWEMEEFSLLENRSHASSVSLRNGSWIITGGQKYFEGVPVLLDTSEMFLHGEFSQGPQLPIPLSGHCSVNIDERKHFLAGGYGEIYLKDSLILHIKEPFWDNLPLMKFGRFGHACGRVMTLFNDIEVIVAGGLHQNRIEKYSFVHQKWFVLPNIEYQPIFKSATVQGESTFLITGGVELEPDCTASNCRQDTNKVYDAYDETLTAKKERLSQGRGNHVATLLPFNAVCISKKLDLLIVGNDFTSGNYVPEVVNIANYENRSKLASQYLSFNDIWAPRVYGIVGTIIREELFICGGGVWPTKCHTEIIFSSSRCQSFNLKEYTLTTLDVAMTEERTFAQSMMFENDTWFIMGGQDSQGTPSDTTEYLDVNEMIFVSKIIMPENFARHCAKMINGSHLFTTGGSKHSRSGDQSVTLSRGQNVNG